jgi:hypothetical protein
MLKKLKTRDFTFKDVDKVYRQTQQQMNAMTTRYFKTLNKVDVVSALKKWAVHQM